MTGKKKARKKPLSGDTQTIANVLLQTTAMPSYKAPTGDSYESGLSAAAVASAVTDWRARALLAFALVSGVGLMIPTLFAGPLVLDEHGTYWLVGPDNPGAMWERSLDYENIPPLAPFLQQQLCRLFGTNEVALRSLSILTYWGAVFAAYLLGRELLGPVGGALAAVVLAWHPTALGEVRIARCYGLTLCLSSLAFWVTLRWCRKPESWWSVPWALLGAALLWTHYLNLAVVGAQGLWLIWSFRRASQRAWIGLLVCVAIVIAAGSPLLPALLRMSQWGSTFNFQSEESVFRVIRPLWWLGLPIAWFVGRCLSTRFWGPTVAIVNCETFVLLLGWGLLPAILAAMLCRDDLASLSNPRYRVGFVAPAACLLAACLCHRRTVGVAGVSILLALSIGWLLTPRWPWELKRLGSGRAVEWRDMALHVERSGRTGEPVFVQGGLGEGFIAPVFYGDLMFQDYLASRMGRFYLRTAHPRYGLPFLWGKSESMADFYRDLLRRRAAANERTLWVAGATDTDLNRLSVEGFETMLAAEGFLEQERITKPNSVLVHYRHEARP